MASEPENVRDTEKQAQELSAKVSAMMLRHPSSRWILRPIRRLAKWIERQTDDWLKDEGWR